MSTVQPDDPYAVAERLEHLARDHLPAPWGLKITQWDDDDFEVRLTHGDEEEVLVYKKSDGNVCHYDLTGSGPAEKTVIRSQL